MMVGKIVDLFYVTDTDKRERVGLMMAGAA